MYYCLALLPLSIATSLPQPTRSAPSRVLWFPLPSSRFPLPVKKREPLAAFGTLEKTTHGPGAADFFFRHHTSNFSTSTLPAGGGGVSDTVPSPKLHTNFCIKPNTGDGRELSPPATQNRTQGTVQSRPPCYIKPNTGDGREPSPPVI